MPEQGFLEGGLELGVGKRLEDVARGSHSHRLGHHLLRFVNGQKNDSRRDGRLQEPPHRFETGHAGHRDVNDDEIRVKRAHRLEERRAIRDRVENLERGLEERANRAQNGGLIVGQDDARFRQFRALVNVRRDVAPSMRITPV